MLSNSSWLVLGYGFQTFEPQGIEALEQNIREIKVLLSSKEND